MPATRTLKCVGSLSSIRDVEAREQIAPPSDLCPQALSNSLEYYLVLAAALEYAAGCVSQSATRVDLSSSSARADGALHVTVASLHHASMAKADNSVDNADLGLRMNRTKLEILVFSELASDFSAGCSTPSNLPVQSFILRLSLSILQCFPFRGCCDVPTPRARI